MVLLDDADFLLAPRNHHKKHFSVQFELEKKRKLINQARDILEILTSIVSGKFLFVFDVFCFFNSKFHDKCNLISRFHFSLR